MDVNAVNSDLYYDNSQNQKDPVKTLDKDAFLQIMVAQLRYQDPSSPMDNDKMIEQIAQFTTLEQITNLNSNFEKLYALQQLSSGSALIGSNVTLQDGDSQVSGTVQKVTTDGTDVKVWVDDKSYDLSQITSVQRGVSGGSEELQSPATSDNSQQPTGDSTAAQTDPGTAEQSA